MSTALATVLEVDRVGSREVISGWNNFSEFQKY